MEYFKLALSKYAQFGGRSRRSEYWYFTFVQGLISFAIGIIGLVFMSAGIESLGQIAMSLQSLFGLAMFIPGLAVFVRRLHDINRSGWWFFIVFIPIVGVLVLLYWLFKAGDVGTNQYGEDPKAAEAAARVAATQPFEASSATVV